MVFKSLNGLAPEYLSSKFITQSNTTSYTFRDSVNKLTIPQPRTNYLCESFRYSGAVLCNSVPETSRQAEPDVILGHFGAVIMISSKANRLTLKQRAKKVVSDSPGLVDFAIGPVKTVLNLPDGQVKIFRRSKITEVL